MKIKIKNSSHAQGHPLYERVDLPDLATVFDQLGTEVEQASSTGKPYSKSWRGMLPWLFLLSVMEQQAQS
jgi:hypothetical protein